MDQKWMFPTAVTVGFQSLGLGVVPRLLPTDRNAGTLEPWNLLLGCKAGAMMTPLQ
jgi:hypothetical protein